MEESIGHGLMHGFKTRGNVALKRGRARVPDYMLLKNYQPVPQRQRKASRWTEEDERLVREVMIDDTRETPSWREIATKVLGGRYTAHEARRRWHDKIIIGLGKRGPWTQEERVSLLTIARDNWDAKRATVTSWPTVMLRLGTGRMHRHVRQCWMRMRVCTAHRLQVSVRDVTPQMMLDEVEKAVAEETKAFMARQDKDITAELAELI